LKKRVLLSILLLASLWAEGRIVADPTVLAIGSRYEAMGGTGVSFADNSQAIFINPALIRKIERNNFSLYSNRYFDEYSYLSLSGVYTVNKTTLGLGFVSNTLDSIPKTTIYSSGGEIRIYQDDEYSVSDRVMLASYAVGLDDFLIFKDFSLGTSFKIASQVVDSSTASGFGFDAGATFELGGFLSGWKFGGVFKNMIAPSLTQSSDEGGSADGSAYESRMVVGGSNTFLLYQKDLMAAVEMDTVDGLHMGLEYHLNEVFRVRAGLDAGDMTYGFGLKMYSDQENQARSSIVCLDYAYHNYAEPLESIHMFTFSFFGAPALEAPVIEYPRNRFVTTADRITVAGKADTGLAISVFVNGKLRSVGKADKDSDWIVKNVYLDDGRNTITVEASVGDQTIAAKNKIIVLSDRTYPKITESIVKRNGSAIEFTAKVSKRVRNVYVKTPDDGTLMMEYDKENDIWKGLWQINERFINQRLTFMIFALDYTNKKSEPEKKSISIKVINYPKDKIIVAGDKVIDVKGKADVFTKSLLVNGQEITPSADRNIKAKVELKDFGKNLLLFTLITSANNKIEIPMRILRVPAPEDLEPFGRENRQAIDILTLGYMQTDKDNKFNAKRRVSKADFSEIIANVKGIKPAQVLKRGYIQGDLTAIVNRAEVVEAIIKMEGMENQEIPEIMPFTDVSETASYYKYVAIAYAAGVLQMSERFSANNSMNRLDVAALLASAPSVSAKIKELYDWNLGYGDRFKEKTSTADKKSK